MRRPCDPGLYFRTIKHLTARQIVDRVRRSVVPARYDLRAAPPRRATSGPPSRPVCRRDGWLGPRRVLLLNREREFGSAIDWTPEGESDLWISTLHSFADLPGTVESGDRPWMPDVVFEWLGSNPPGPTWGWNPYATSRRIVNWILWILAGAEPPAGAVDSLAVQIRHVANRIEYHLMANHLLANACALVAGGLFFTGPEAERWLGSGVEILRRELVEQVLADGGHFERAPMYQGVIIEDLLDLLNLSRVFPNAGGPMPDARGEVQAAASRMLSWLAAMIHPDGEIAFFNDSTTGVAATYGELCQYGEVLGLPAAVPKLGSTAHLSESGYARLASPDARTLVLFDVGPIGPDYQPGHSHCDTLSVEISRSGRRIVVNSGISTYERGPERLRQRRTAAHTTVRIDGAEQSEVWASHRCGLRARPLGTTAGDGWAEGAHDGYRRLPGGPVHRRRVTVRPERVAIRDTVEGGGEHLIEWFFHLHPDITVEERDGEALLAAAGTPVGRLRFPEGLGFRVEEGSWHPGFHLSRPNPRIVASVCSPLPVAVEIALDFEDT